MGGGGKPIPTFYSTEEESSPEPTIACSSCGDEESSNVEPKNGSLIGKASGLDLREFEDVGRHNNLIHEAAERKRCKVYDEVVNSYQSLLSRIDRLEDAKSKVLSYTPGSWIEKAGGVDLLDYDVPQTTSLILVGPKGSGKSSLVNKISAVLEDDMFGFERAQVTYKPSSRDGTYFLHKYMIPRGSSSFCLYDTRSLSDDSSENEEMLKSWMTDGVRHGELVNRKSDTAALKDQLKFKARRNCMSSLFREVNFVIFVVNGIDVLESMGAEDEKKEHYSQVMSEAFNNPFLSFKDDKPVVAVTHGDLLSLSDRVRIRLYLGDLLRVHPARQIFDIPESNDSATALTIGDMLNYCLDRADRNLPCQDMHSTKVHPFLACLFLMMVAITFIIGKNGSRSNH